MSVRNTRQGFLQLCHAGSISERNPNHRLNSVMGKMWFQAIRSFSSNHPMTWVGVTLIWVTVASKRSKILPFRKITQRWGSSGMLLVSASIRGKGFLSMRGEGSLRSAIFSLGINGAFGQKCEVTTFQLHIKGGHIGTHKSRVWCNLMARGVPCVFGLGLTRTKITIISFTLPIRCTFGVTSMDHISRVGPTYVVSD